MLATTGEAGRDGDAFSYEVKWDDWRAMVYIDHGLRVRTRTGGRVSDCLPELTGLVDALEGHRVILDGELVACVDGKVDLLPLRAQNDGCRARGPLGCQRGPRQSSQISSDTLTATASTSSAGCQSGRSAPQCWSYEEASDHVRIKRRDLPPL
jgi:hypothetical protein